MERAKALLEYEGKPILSHIVEKVPPEMDIMISTNRKFETDFYQWRETLSREVEICVEDVWSPEQAKGAVGSLKFWVESKAIVGDLLVIAGDNYFEFDLSQFIAAYDRKNALVAVHDVGDRAKAKQFGVVELHKDRIIALEEKPAHPKSTLVATACYILPAPTFPFLLKYCSRGKIDNLGGFIAYLVEKGAVRAYVFTQFWLDVGTPQTFSDLAERIKW
jgi:glucose-1-phosphate thymidylyltransferase